LTRWKDRTLLPPVVDRDKRADDEDDDQPEGEADEEESSEQDDSSDEHSDEDGDADEHEPDARAAAVAKSLGVGEAEAPSDEAKKTEEEEAPQNRAARRRARALERRGRRAAEAGEEAPAEAPAPAEPAAAATPQSRERDRNKRLREELLAKRREAAKQAGAPAAPAQQGLAASEVAEDVLVRATASVTRWVSKHRSTAGWILFGGIAAGAALVFYLYRTETVTAAAADLLTRAAVVDQSPVLEPSADKRTPEQVAEDPRKIYPSVEERSKAALEAYDKVMAEHPGTGSALLAQLGRAGVLLEQQKWDDAIKAYDAVLASQLAPADADVRARALEGLGFAKEGKGDVDGAIAAFQQLDPIAGFKALGLYHRARLLYGKKNQADEAKKLVLEAREILEKSNIELRAAGGEASTRWLTGSVTALLQQIDPKAAPAKPANPGPEMTQEQLRKILEQRGLDGQLPPGGEPQ
jgi:tetratricopeptide (TPR) repeat protein